MKKLFGTTHQRLEVDVVLLIIRLVCGYVMIQAGWPKIQNPMGWMGPDSVFPGLLLLLAAVAEFGGGIALLLGLFTQLAALGIFFTMIGAIYLHKFVMGDPFINPTGGSSYQVAAVYLLFSMLFMVIGGSRFSLDRKLFGIKN